MTATNMLGRGYAGKIALRIAAVAIALSWLCPACAATESDTSVARTYRGPAVAIGNGEARTVVLTNSANRPIAIGVELTEGALSGLSAQPNTADTMLDWHYFLQLPEAAPATGFDHVMVNWHPLGHTPQGIYTLPHFDFHFYVIDRNSQLAIHYAHPDTPDISDVTMPAAALIPPGYSIPPGTQISRMGLHAIRDAAPEFHSHKFTNTLIYGYDGKGALAFLEPMLTMDYLKTRPRDVAPIAVPASYSHPGYYPARYSVTYDADGRIYRVILDQLTPWQAPAAPAPR
jgi:hypothetical protein